MKFISTIILFAFFFILGGFKTIIQSDNVEFVCLKKQMAANQCHYNFKVDGAKYRYVDIGCRFRKKDEVVKKVKEGSLALARDWKIDCREPREKKTKSEY